MSNARFSGFSDIALQLLSDLKENNDRDWFAPRKELYDAEVKSPMLTLVHEVAAACQQKGFALFPKERSPVSRVYRDIRFSPDKRPFQHHIGATLHGRASKTTFGEMYIHVAPESCFVAAGFYLPDPAFLRLARTRMAEQPAEFDAVVKALRKKGLEFGAEGKLKRMPRGFERFADSQAADYLKLSSLIVIRKLDRDAVTTPALVQVAANFALAARPLLEWGWGLGYKPAPRREMEFGGSGDLRRRA